MMVTVLVQSIHDEGLAMYKTMLCTARGRPSLETRVTSVNALPGATCRFLSNAGLVKYKIGYPINLGENS